MLDKTDERELALKTMRSWNGEERRLVPASFYVKARLISYFTLLILASCMLSGFYISAKFVWEHWL